MFIFNIGIPKHKKHLRLLSSGTKLFITFELKGFFDIRREIPFFYADFSISPPPHTQHVRPRKSTDFFRARNSTNWLFSNPPKSSAHVSGAWRHSQPLVSFPIWDFYFDISEWHILPARVWTPAFMLHLTNPCAKRKVLSLTKPKDKIYKTKSLGHYITMIPNNIRFNIWCHIKNSKILISFIYFRKYFIWNVFWFMGNTPKRERER